MIEKRRDQRVEENLVLRVASPEKAGRFGITWNRSRGGVVFVTPSAFRVGDELTLSLSEPAAGDAETRRGRIVRVATTGEAPMRFLVAVTLDA